MVSDRVGDFIIRLKNAGAIGKSEAATPYSTHLEAIAKKLKELGYVAGVEKTGEVKKTLTVKLSYNAQGVSAIGGVKRLSSPGRRLYTPARSAHGVKNGVGDRILSTPKGILSDAEARKAHTGGETLFEIW